jgi:transposase
MGTTATERRHKRWPEALKREIVAASWGGGLNRSPAIRREREPGLRRKRYREDARARSKLTVPQLVPVVITAEQDAVAAQPPVVTEKIEIDVSGKYRIRVACGFDGQALRRVPEVT